MLAVLLLADDIVDGIVVGLADTMGHQPKRDLKIQLSTNQSAVAVVANTYRSILSNLLQNIVGGVNGRFEVDQRAAFAFASRRPTGDVELRALFAYCRLHSSTKFFGVAHRIQRFVTLSLETLQLRL